MNKTKAEIRRAVRAVERAIDATDLLRDLGYGSEHTERAISELRYAQGVINDDAVKADA